MEGINFIFCTDFNYSNVLFVPGKWIITIYVTCNGNNTCFYDGRNLLLFWEYQP